MKALAWYGAKDVRMIDAPIPDITQDDDVIIQVTGTTICGSDLHLYHGEIVTLQQGDILGHEVCLRAVLWACGLTDFGWAGKFMGVVEKVGPNVSKLKLGQRVVVSFQVAWYVC